MRAKEKFPLYNPKPLSIEENKISITGTIGLNLLMHYGSIVGKE